MSNLAHSASFHDNEKIAPSKPGIKHKPRDVPRVDDRRVISGIIHVIRGGLMWRDAPAAYGPPKTLYNRFIRWSRIGVFDRIFATLAAASEATHTVMIDATHLKAHRTAACLLKFEDQETIRGIVSPKNGLFPGVSAARKAV